MSFTSSLLCLLEIGMACLLRMFDSINLPNQAPVTLHADQRENSWVYEVHFFFVHLRELKAALVCLFIFGIELGDFTSLHPFMDSQIVVGPIEKDIYSLRSALAMAKKKNFKILYHNDANLNTIDLAQGLQLWDPTPGIRATR